MTQDENAPPPACNNTANAARAFSFDVSPKKKRAVGAEKALVLRLAPFEQPVCVSFGNVRLGSKKSVSLTICNPSAKTVDIVLDMSHVVDKGFSVDRPSVVVAPNSTRSVTFIWQPDVVGNVRAPVTLALGTSRLKLQVFLLGFAVSAQATKNFASETFKSMKRKSPHPWNDTSCKISKQVKEAVPKQLRLKRHVRSATSEFITKPELYEVDWLDKQEKAFVCWLNHELYQESGPRMNDTNESMSSYSCNLEKQRTRAAAFSLYQSSEIVDCLSKICREISTNKLTIRRDINLNADIGVREDIINLLMSYNPKWLLLGLEVVGGFQVTSEFYDESILKEFLEKEILGIQLVKKYSDNDYTAYCNRFLKRFLALIFFLDRSKTRRVLSDDSILFRKNSLFKSTRVLLNTFSSKYLQGEGDLLRHLGYFGFNISHQQNLMDEIDLSVHSLAKDLRDGLRIAKLCELNYKTSNLMREMKYPANTKSMMMLNYERIFDFLFNKGIVLPHKEARELAEDIIEGHRERTISFLWLLMTSWKIPLLVDEAKLRDEIYMLKAELSRKKISLRHDAASVSMDSSHCNMLFEWVQLIAAFYDIPVTNFTSSFANGRVFCAIVNFYFPAIMNKYMIAWCDVNNSEELLTNNGASNRDVHFGDDKEKLSSEKNLELFYEKLDELGGVPFLQNVRSLCQFPDEKLTIITLSYLCNRILSLQKEIKAAKTIQYVWKKHHLRKVYFKRRNAAKIIENAFLNFRQKRNALIQKRKISIAITIIQRAFRAKRKIRNCLSSWCLFVHRIILFQSHIRTFLAMRRFQKLHKSAVCIQSNYRAFRARKLLKQNKLIRGLQSVCRGFLVRKFVNAQQAAKKCVAWWRAIKMRQEFKRMQMSTRLIQNFWRSKQLADHQRRKYQHIINATLTIQQWWRAIKIAKKERNYFVKTVRNVRISQTIIRKWLARRRKAATKIQAVVRMSLIRLKFVRLVSAVKFMQRRYVANTLMRLQRSKLSALKKSVIFVENQRVKTLNYRKEVENLAARLIQSKWRLYVFGKQARMNYIKLKNSVVTLQRKYRELVSIRRENAATIIQKYFRGYRFYKHYCLLKAASKFVADKRKAMVLAKYYQEHFAAMKTSAIIIQRRYCAQLYMKKEKEKFLDLKRSCIIIQRLWRRYYFNKRVSATTTLQSFVRMYRARRQFILFKTATNLISNAIKSWIVRKRFAESKKASIIIQKNFRRYITQKSYKRLVREKDDYRVRVLQNLRKRISMCMIQEFLRKCISRRRFIVKEAAATRIQARWRQHRQKNVYESQRKTLILVQNLWKRKFANLFLAASVIQKWWKSSFERRNYVLLLRSSIHIQRYWRGYKVRKICRHEVESARKRLLVANAAAQEHMKLGNRTTTALTVLHDSVSLSSIIKACSHLEVVTRLSRSCCLQLMNSNAIEIMYGLIRSCNRSKPHMEVLRHCVQIILNLTRHSETSKMLLAPKKSWDVYVDLLQHYKDNDDIFFPVLNSLINFTDYVEIQKALLSQRELKRSIQTLEAYFNRRHQQDLKNNKKEKYALQVKLLRQISSQFY